MNEEEKKALKVINARTKRLLDEFKIEKEDMSDEPKIAYLMQEIRANKTILNLIEKLQKENEKLKNKLLDTLEGQKVIEEETPQYIKGNYIPVQIVKDKIEKILNNKEYRIVFEGNAEFPDDATIINAQKYIKLEKMQELIEESEEK